MRRLIAPLMIAMVATAPAIARDSLGVFERWGSFRDPAGPRCYAIAQPVKPQRTTAFAAIGYWPARHVRGQVNLRLSRQRRPDTPVRLAIGDRRFTLVAGAADAWAADARADAAIIAAIRSGTAMAVEATDRSGRIFADAYALRGAATAIDAAALGCARGR